MHFAHEDKGLRPSRWPGDPGRRQAGVIWKIGGGLDGRLRAHYGSVKLHGLRTPDRAACRGANEAVDSVPHATQRSLDANRMARS